MNTYIYIYISLSLLSSSSVSLSQALRILTADRGGGWGIKHIIVVRIERISFEISELVYKISGDQFLAKTLYQVSLGWGPARAGRLNAVAGLAQRDL